jgi:hypothetical protein
MAKKFWINAAGAPDRETPTGIEFSFKADVTDENKNPVGPVVQVQLADLPAKIVHLLALHGLSQKVGDSYAAALKEGGKDPVAWSVQQVNDVLKGLKEGIFNAGRSGGGAPRVSLLARALHAIKVAAGEVSTEAEAQAYVEALEAQPDGKAQIAELKSKKKVARMLDTIRLEDAAAKLARAQAKVAAGGEDDEEDETEE